MQMAQDAQAGHACDDCTGRQPMACNGVNECCKRHRALAEHIRQEPFTTSRKTARHSYYE